MPELQEPVIVVAEGAQFALLSCGNGAAYVLRSKEDQASAYFEGDDVAAFLTEYDAVKAQYPSYNTDQMLAQLWDQGGYSWMAIPDAE
ncbi:hypothetical protein [Methylocaldum sp.]|uniref:hypothetical protein n=1 Tax=Methylocaldum sp. TaxID=1969727 RepID=UPI002D7411C3|nr:hypothetical protein [Methylocaldum sp.]HYE37204.1 hypothetical protein [Methylocaldum sp.]